MATVIKQKFDKNNNVIYRKDFNGFEFWFEYNENNNLIYFKNSNNYEFWQEFDENKNKIHFKNSLGNEYWFKYKTEILYRQIKITEQEFKNIKIKEYNSRTKCSRFELMEI